MVVSCREVRTEPGLQAVWQLIWFIFCILHIRIGNLDQTLPERK